MEDKDKILEDLRKKYSDEEIAEAYMIPATLSPEEAEKERQKLLAFRFKLLEEQSEEERIYSDVLMLKYQIEDYLENGVYIEEKSFGKFVEAYARILNRTKKKLAEDLSIHYTRLSQIINGRKEPNLALIHRLEVHSGYLIPAICWWKLVVKKQEAYLLKDTATKQEEALKVSNAMKFSA